MGALAIAKLDKTTPHNVATTSAFIMTIISFQFANVFLTLADTGPSGKSYA